MSTAGLEGCRNKKINKTMIRSEKNVSYSFNLKIILGTIPEISHKNVRWICALLSEPSNTRLTFAILTLQFKCQAKCMTFQQIANMYQEFSF